MLHHFKIISLLCTSVFQVKYMVLYFVIMFTETECQINIILTLRTNQNQLYGNSGAIFCKVEINFPCPSFPPTNNRISLVPDPFCPPRRSLNMNLSSTSIPLSANSEICLLEPFPGS